jgi:hypothetical protein
MSVHTWALTLLDNASWLTPGVIGAFPIVISNLLSAAGSVAVLGAVQLQQRHKRLGRTAAAAAGARRSSQGRAAPAPRDGPAGQITWTVRA